MKSIKTFFCFLLFIFHFSFFTSAQIDLLKLIDTTANTPRKAPSTWKDTKLINIQTTKTVDPGVMEFFILHRFGNVGGASGGGIHTLGGFDIASDILMGFQFGITKNFQVGISRSKQQELIDLDTKYKLLTQTSKMPISVAIYGDAGFTPELTTTLYSGADPMYPQENIDRLSYFGELMIDRRFGNHFSIEALGGMQHRNYLLATINLTNGAKEMNNIPFAGIGGRILFNKHSSLVFDGYYAFSQFRTNNTGTPFYFPFAIGYEVETGGHVFEINFTNASFLNENNIIPNTRDTWTKGGFKLGFSISRVFNL